MKKMKSPSLNAETIYGSEQGYLDPGQSIRRNVDPEDRSSLEKLIGKGGGGGANHPSFSF